MIANLEGANRVELFQWGVVPSWAKDISIGNPMINARAETPGGKHGLDKDDDILKATVRFDQIRLVRQCLAAVILILAYFDQRKFRRGVREPGLADNRTCVSVDKDRFDS